MMAPEVVLEILYQALLVTVKISAPLLLIALGVGVLVSIIQALTQIQETTLSFVPKIMALFLVLALMMPYMGTILGGFTHDLFNRIVNP